MTEIKPARRGAPLLSLLVTIGRLPGGAYSVTVTSDDMAPVATFCDTHIEAALRAADVLASYAALLVRIARREEAAENERPRIIRPN